jgi:hypoxanthine phosphoribosyltransferase/NTP pyrophosphatase (non-canonical NTP hydrolase)
MRMKKIYLGDLAFSESMRSLGEKIKQSKFKPDTLVCVGRGGMEPTRRLSDILGIKDVVFIPVSLYTGVGTRNNKPSLGTMSSSVFKKNVLLVDDIMDSGVTINTVLDALRKANVSDIKTATIYCKSHVVSKPSFYDLTSEDDEWVVFPWEENEFGEGQPKRVLAFEEYQKHAHSTSLNTEIHGDKVLYPIIALPGEAGEVCGKLKKLYRDSNGVYDDDFKAAIEKELGCVQWYISEIATQLGMSLNDIAISNLDKLASRKERGTIKGDGDDR